MQDSIETIKNSSQIELSDNVNGLLEMLKEIKPSAKGITSEEYQVSQTVSLFGFFYEKLRNAVEFNEEHLIRRHAIARISRRRLQINPKGIREGENMVRELLWAKYIDFNNLSQGDIAQVQKIIDKYLLLFQNILEIYKKRKYKHFYKIIVDLMSCEIEEAISIELSQKKRAFLYFFYQTLKDKIELKNTPEDVKDQLFYIAAEKALFSNDDIFVRYHLFVLFFDRLVDIEDSKIVRVSQKFSEYLLTTHTLFRNINNGLILKFTQSQVAPFKILNNIIAETNLSSIQGILVDSKKFKEKVEEACKARYAETSLKLRNAAIRSTSYIFLTKMIFIFILELPLTKYIYGGFELLPIIVNMIFPPLLMGLIVLFISPPTDDNTHKIYQRIIEVLNKDNSFETGKIFLKQRFRTRNPSLLLTFSVLYIVLFSIVFGTIYYVLDLLGYNIISKIVFIFFLCVVAFFGYRIRQTAKEYVLESKSNIFINIATFLFLPILYVGKLLSSQISRIDIFIIVFDLIIEAPFKLIIEVVEEWTRFIKARKEELI